MRQNAPVAKKDIQPIMKTVLLSYFSAARSLSRPGILWHLMWPTLAASVLWTSLLVINWGVMIAQGAAFITALPLVGGWISGSEVAMMVALVMFKIGLVVLAFGVSVAIGIIFGGYHPEASKLISQMNKKKISSFLLMLINA